MSSNLSDQKASLFSKGNNTSTSSSNTNSTTSHHHANTSTNTKSGGGGGGGLLASLDLTSKSSVSPEVKRKKKAEAEGYLAKAEEALKTTIFKWKPDHLMAAPHFESAATCYRAAEEYNLAIDALLKASECHDGYGAGAAAAMALVKAAQIAKDAKQAERAGELYAKCAMTWGLSGDLPKAGDFYCKAAGELEKVNTKKAKEYYLKGLELIIPVHGSDNQIMNSPAITTELMRSALKFFITHRPAGEGEGTKGHITNTEVLELATRALRLNTLLGNEATKTRLMITIIFLHLENGNYSTANQHFLDFLSDKDFMNCSESRLADDFLAAFRTCDIEELEKAQSSPDMYHLDREIQRMARGLSLLNVEMGEEDMKHEIVSKDLMKQLAKITTVGGKSKDDGKVEEVSDEEVELPLGLGDGKEEVGDESKSSSPADISDEEPELPLAASSERKELGDEEDESKEEGEGKHRHADEKKEVGGQEEEEEEDDLGLM